MITQGNPVVICLLKGRFRRPAFLGQHALRNLKPLRGKGLATSSRHQRIGVEHADHHPLDPAARMAWVQGGVRPVWLQGSRVT